MSASMIIFAILFIALAGLIVKEVANKMKAPYAPSYKNLIIIVAVILCAFVIFYIVIMVIGAFAGALAEARRGG